MKKLNKFFAVLVALAMMATLCVTMAFAEDPTPNTVDFAVTKLLKVPAGTDIPANTTVDIVIDNTKINSVAAGDTYDKTFNDFSLAAADADVTETKNATTYYYFTTENMLAQLGLNSAPAGVYEFDIYETDYKVGGTAYDALEAPQFADIENGGHYTLTVAKTVNDTYSITASQNGSKVEVKEVKTGEEHDASITGNGVKLINSYWEKGSGDTFETATFKVTKDVQNDNGLYVDGDAFTMDLTVVLPDIEDVTAEGFIRHYNYNAETGKPEDTPVSFTSTDKNLSLAKGDIFYLTKAPAGTLVTVAEDDDRAGDQDDGKMYIKSGEFADAKVTAELQEKTITNTYNETTQEGVLHNSIPYIVLALVAIGGMVAYVVVRRRNADEA